MLFGKIFAFAAVALAPFVSAQSSTLQFTALPGPFTIGKPATITWSGGSGDSVTLILRQGATTSNLTTVGIIASNVQGNTYTWTPASSLTPGNDYTLQIEQGVDDNNFSGFFSIQSAAQGSVTTIFAAAGSSTIAVATITPSMNSSSSVTMMMGTGTGTGTGANMPRNTTMVSPTLSGTAVVTTTATESGSGSGTGSTSGAGAATTSSHTGGAIAQASARAVLGLGAVAAAAMYLL